MYDAMIRELMWATQALTKAWNEQVRRRDGVEGVMVVLVRQSFLAEIGALKEALSRVTNAFAAIESQRATLETALNLSKSVESAKSDAPA